MMRAITPVVGWLDCQTSTSALSSFAAIAQLDPRQLQSTFADFDLDGHCSADGRWEEPGDVLLRLAAGRGRTIPEPDTICWFHAARVPRDTSFATNGILPVSQAADWLWATLRAADPDPPATAAWEDFRTAVESGRLGEWGHLYALKQRMPGPFAFLIREELDHIGDTNSVDYFAGPESVVDICRCYAEWFGRSGLLAAYQAATVPCVVKFVDSRPQRVMRTVACYLYRHARRQRAYDCNTYLDSQGVPIRPEQILDIQWLPAYAQRPH